MNATERARRSDALYYDSISRRELCDRIADLESDMDSHRALCDMIANLESDLTESKAENAKLRELVRDAWGDGHPDRSCEGCDIRDECHDDVERMRKDGVLRFSRCLFELRIEERMRELGIEVAE